ncbi:CopG family transcriptional regulator [Roseivivax halodurans JCM 10272]|uniref:CopG family transcriptional regulator n=1 Tax=Roseivivax halodurans JCM 10272 TaxID=1449350 RepID=X7ECM6_9RHOB|nr:type II toxin-antitoxin system ParD family antitoxin [Roseivivax halodurans]ETX12863.1 CopG family transcriptional regulator [Roseivivax halodurans JCM 10272]
MATMNVSLPDPMKTWVEQQTAQGRYANASDYVRDLIRRDQARSDAIARMQGLVDEGLRSGDGSRSMAEIKAQARRRAGLSEE